jgi:hypothetical protein
MPSLEVGVTQSPQSVLLYGDPAAGKSSLAADLKAAGFTPIFLDVNDGSRELDVVRIPKSQLPTWESVIAMVNPNATVTGKGGKDVPLWTSKPGTVCVIDTLSDCEQLCREYLFRTVPAQNGAFVERIEDYGFGKGFVHIDGEMTKLLQALDALLASGVHVILIAHCETERVPNPTGEDWIRWAPRIQNPERANTRARTIGWAKHVLHVGLDAAISKDGKARGAGTRSITPSCTPSLVAKSRLLTESIPFILGDGELWKQILPPAPTKKGGE